MSSNVAIMDQPELVGSGSTRAAAPLVIGEQEVATDMAVSLHVAPQDESLDAGSTLSALYELTKPRIVLMVLITCGVAAFFLAGASASAFVMLNLMIGTAGVAASASVLNQYVEREPDALMSRTSRRPLPSGRVTPGQALAFGLLLGILGTAYLQFTIGPVSALVGVATWVGYVAIYTPLKQKTAWNTTVGAVAGALPMLMGFTAVGGGLEDPRGWLLVAVLFFWQYPHFMAIAWMYRSQYEQAGFKMTPVVQPSGRSAGVQSILGALALPASLLCLLYPFDYFLVYAAFAILVSFGMLRASVQFYRQPNDATARKLLRSSLVQLPAAMAVLMVARMLG